MGLFDKLVTDNSRFRTLKYSEFDTELLVETPLPGVTEELNYLDLPGGDGPAVDFIRGGLGNIASRRDDVTRITKFFATTQGALFIAKQEALSNLGVRTQAGGTLNEGLYLPTSTIAQVGLMGTGTFLNKQGVDPTGALPARTRPIYFDAENKDLIQNTNSNRLYLLRDKIDNTAKKFIYDKRSTISNNDENLLTYRGGPNKFGGIGVTNIPYLNDQRTSVLNPYFKNNNLLVFNKKSKDFSPIPLTNPDSPLVSAPKRKTEYFKSRLEDFRRGLYNSLDKDTEGNIFSANISHAPDYNIRNIETRVNLGNPGDPNYNRYNYAKGITYNTDINALDTINAFPLYKASNVDPNQTSPGGPLNDLVKFRIAAIDNDTPTKKVFIHFRAFLNSMTDNYNPDWGSEKYVGRGDTLYKYGGFTRAVNLSWTVVAQSGQEMMPMYRKLNYLASNTMPDYSEAGYMRGPLIELTVGGYLYDQPGFITSLNYTLRTDTGWEIGIGSTYGDELDDEPGDNLEQYELPHAIDVQMGFTPIHEFLPGKVKGDLIAPGDPFVTNINNKAPTSVAGWENKEGDNIYLVNQYKNYIALTDKGNTFNNY